MLLKAAMKLVRISAFAFVALSAACASRPAPPAAAPVPDTVSTTNVNAAAWEEEATPRVGKPQRSDDASKADDLLDAPKDEPRRHESKKSWK